MPYTFRPRHAGESKMSSLVVVQFLGLVLSKMTGGLLPTSFLLFGLVGGIGVAVHMGTLWAASQWLDVSNSTNFAEAADHRRDRRDDLQFRAQQRADLRQQEAAWLALLTGLLTFYAVCSIGAIANVSVASLDLQVRREPLDRRSRRRADERCLQLLGHRVFTWR